jgi:hypothetical protein
MLVKQIMFKKKVDQTSKEKRNAMTEISINE